MIPRGQCVASELKLPPYFMEWINIKRVHLNYYEVQATRTVSMFRQHGIPLLGSHCLGMNGTKNITKLVQQMLADGAVMEINAWRNVDFSLENRKQRRQRKFGRSSFSADRINSRELHLEKMHKGARVFT